MSNAARHGLKGSEAKHSPYTKKPCRPITRAVRIGKAPRKAVWDVWQRNMRDPWEISCVNGNLLSSGAREKKVIFLFRASDDNIVANVTICTGEVSCVVVIA